MIKKINHVGIAVKNLDQALKFFKETYGARLIHREKYEDQKMESALISIVDAQFELLASLAPQSGIDRFIQSRGEGMHHVSLEVDEFDQTIKDFKAKGLKIISEADTDNFKAAFIHPQSNFGMLTEIVQIKKEYGES